MPHHIDRVRATREMAAAGLDALVLFQPEHVTWTIGVNPGPAGLFRRAGAASVSIPADPAAPLAAVMPDLMAGAMRAAGSSANVVYHRIWVDTAVARPHGHDDALTVVLGGTAAPPRPSTFDVRAAFGLLREQLAAMGLLKARLGLDLGFVPAVDFVTLQTLLTGATLIDATDTIRRLRMVKTAAEIAQLRLAAKLGDAGLHAALSAVRLGVTRETLSRAYADGVRAAAHGQAHALWDYISVGPDPWGAGRPAETGDIIKCDVGVVIGGYSSDMARTVVCGSPSRAARELHAALLAGLEAGIGLMQPGVRLSDVHAAMLQTIRGHGVASYSRGHFGHGLGNDPFSEQWPFIAADSDVVLEPGMVMAVEAPHYVDGLGGFIIEDQVLVTAGGVESMTHLPRALAVYD